jgi:DNA polymerase-1
MRYLTDAARAAEAGNDLRTRGGRLVRMSSGADPTDDERGQRSRAAARGRYGRNAMVQGAAAEFFKTWTAIVRARIPASAQIVLCLHDELLVQVPTHVAPDVARVVDAALEEAAAWWRQPDQRADVHFVSDTSIITRWSESG